MHTKFLSKWANNSLFRIFFSLLLFFFSVFFFVCIFFCIIPTKFAWMLWVVKNAVPNAKCALTPMKVVEAPTATCVRSWNAIFFASKKRINLICFPLIFKYPECVSHHQFGFQNYPIINFSVWCSIWIVQ